MNTIEFKTLARSSEVSKLASVSGTLQHMIYTRHPDIDHADEYVHNTTACANSTSSSCSQMNHGYSILSQVVEDEPSVEKIPNLSPNKPGDDQPICNGRRNVLFSSRCLNVALIVFLVINAFCLFAPMRQLSLVAQAIKPHLEGRAFLDTRDLPHPGPYYGL
ncbi:hypothetical protein F5141DRAFT_436924 [Pisolithus sp. B1]|nr:hypothetical protein F5141DRAFT_436924 [Pisolithus sp. B1]